MNLVANDEKKKKLLFINDNFLKYPLLNKHLSLQELLFPSKELFTLIPDVEDVYTLLEINVAVFNTLPSTPPFGFDFDALTEEQRLLLNSRMVERPLAAKVAGWINDSHEFYVKSSASDCIVCISSGDAALSQGFVKMQSDGIKEVLLELFYSQFTYFDIHNLSRPNKTETVYEVTVAKAFELGLN